MGNEPLLAMRTWLGSEMRSCASARRRGTYLGDDRVSSPSSYKVGHSSRCRRLERIAACEPRNPNVSWSPSRAPPSSSRSSPALPALRTVPSTLVGLTDVVLNPAVVRSVRIYNDGRRSGDGGFYGRCDLWDRAVAVSRERHAAGSLAGARARSVGGWGGVGVG